MVVWSLYSSTLITHKKRPGPATGLDLHLEFNLELDLDLDLDSGRGSVLTTRELVVTSGCTLDDYAESLKPSQE